MFVFEKLLEFSNFLIIKYFIISFDVTLLLASIFGAIGYYITWCWKLKPRETATENEDKEKFDITFWIMIIIGVDILSVIGLSTSLLDNLYVIALFVSIITILVIIAATNLKHKEDIAFIVVFSAISLLSVMYCYFIKIVKIK